MAELQNGIPNRPTLDDVFARWDEQHKERFGTYVNLATAGQENYDKQIKELTQETQSQQSAWDKKYGNTAEGQIIAQNPPPDWEDIYKTWAQDYKRVFGTDVLDRPWNADADAIRQKEELDTRYLDALNSYNKTFGVNVLPDEGVLGSNVQPNAFYKEPEKKSGGIGGFFASIDPGKAIGKGLAEVDTTVNRELPGGWALPAAVAAAIATGYVDPSLFAAEAGSGFVGLDAATAAELGLSGGSGLSAAGTSGNVLAGIYGAESALGSGFAGLTPEYASELGLSGGSGLTGEGASGNVLQGITGAESTSVKDALSTANRARSLANMLTGGQKGVQQMNMPNVQMPQFEQFGGLYRGNQNPFLMDRAPVTTALPQTQNFLAELAQQGKTNDLASLLRNV